MSKIVVISGHPDLEKSHTNTVILKCLEDSPESMDIRRLDRLYPDFRIDVEAEQAALKAADVIVLQFPFHWYAVPALLKKWVDDVFSYNFAYGPEGDKLKGKDFILSLTIGGAEETYDPLGYNHFKIEQFLHPLQQTAYLAGLVYRAPVYTHRMVYIPGVYNRLEDVQSRARDHAGRLLEQIDGLLNSPQARIERFVTEWFRQFDQLPQSSDWFLEHLDRDVNWVMPDGRYSGHAGFRDWYSHARETFRPGCDHQVEQLEVRRSDTGYQVDLRIRLLAETFEGSPFGGEAVNMLVNETWQVSLDAQGRVTIHDYLVEAVDSQA
ncbi:NAD(P)H-dependent oxidoreductase [Kiloniella sp. b19]|uniref:NAD(P)H-dependent oxidoreductase n=1 Tax=Kiloniella sp. GXU_MW_B19 TaxID=3141326 RepID=UPI0031CDC08C